MKKYLLSFVLVTSFATFLNAASDFLFNSENSPHITINNRILAKVNGKAISVFDVMKKMDMLFYRQYPEYTGSIPAKFQFYQVNWKYVAAELIDKELILADASENKLPITNGDIRQEMEALFGPNIISNLDKIGMTYDEAWNIVKGDITLRRMVQYKINNKAIREITPQAIRLAYQEYTKDNEIPKSFTYQVISIRDKDESRGEKLAKTIENELKNQILTLSDLETRIKQETDTLTHISLTDELKHTEKEMSNNYKESVLALNAGQFSDVVSQKSRADNSTVFRIFYLKEKNEGGPPAFTSVENIIKGKLQNVLLEKETLAYLKKLRSYFDVQESHLVELNTQDFQPFSMK